MDILSIIDDFWPLGYETGVKACPLCAAEWVEVHPLGIAGERCPYCDYQEPEVEHLRPGDGLWVVMDPYQAIYWPMAEEAPE